MLEDNCKMKVNVKAMTDVINKISDLTNGDKVVPGILLNLSEDGTLKIAYSDGHKSFIEHIAATVEDGDRFDNTIVDFTMLKKALAKCQPSGLIKVDDITLTYGEKTITVSATLKYIEQDGENEIERNMGTKSMELLILAPSMRTEVLTRMNYDSIFETDAVDDEFDKAELVSALARTSIEKGKQVYMSTKAQTIFVANQAHLTSVPVSKGKTLTQEELDELRAELIEAGAFTEENFAAEIKTREKRMHYSCAIPQNIAKAIVGILGRTGGADDKVYMHTKDKFCSIYVDTDNVHMGIWFEMAQASKAHLGTLERYSAQKYQTYQTSFLREFLVDAVKSAMDSTKTDKVTFKFDNNAEDGNPELVINAGSAAASTAEVYRVMLDTMLDPSNTLIGSTFSISIKVLNDMLSQLKTDLVALDFECTENSQSIRLAELDFMKENELYEKAREKTKKLCESQGIEFDPNSTPTPPELKWEYREATLGTKQFTMLAK